MEIHIAVPVDDVGTTWDIVKDILIDERIAETKVVQPGIVFDELERGKQITIYQFCNPNRDWEMILQRIEIALRKAYKEGYIHRGQFCSSDRPIPESLFLAYRNDARRDGSYISEKAAMKFAIPYNPFGQPDDPFSNITFSRYVPGDTTTPVFQGSSGPS